MCIHPCTFLPLYHTSWKIIIGYLTLILHYETMKRQCWTSISVVDDGVCWKLGDSRSLVHNSSWKRISSLIVQLKISNQLIIYPVKPLPFMWPFKIIHELRSQKFKMTYFITFVKWLVYKYKRMVHAKAKVNCAVKCFKHFWTLHIRILCFPYVPPKVWDFFCNVHFLNS